MKRFELLFAGTRVSEIPLEQQEADIAAVQSFLKESTLPRYQEFTRGLGLLRKMSDQSYGRSIAPTARLSRKVSCGRDVTIQDGATICSGAKIGDGAFIGANTFIGEKAIVGAGCKLCPCTIVDHGVVLQPGCVISNEPGCVVPVFPSLVVIRSNLGHGARVLGRVYIGPSCSIGQESCVGLPDQITILAPHARVGHKALVAGPISGATCVPPHARLRTEFSQVLEQIVDWFALSLPPGATVTLN